MGGYLGILLNGCTSDIPFVGSGSLNSRYNDESPAVSADGHYLAFTSSRQGRQTLQVYDLQQRQFLWLPQPNRGGAVIDSPSLSYTGRYITYLASRSGRMELELYDRVSQQIQVLSWGYPGWIRSPSISPDGRYIAVETSRHGQWDIEMFDRGPSVQPDRPSAPQSPKP